MQKQSSTQSVPKLPKAQFGILTPPADINRYDNIPKPSFLNKQAQETLAKRNNPSNRPSISQYTPKLGEQAKFNKQKLERIAEDNAPLNRMAASQGAENMQDAIEAAMIMEGGMFAGKFIGKGAKAVTKYATENTALKNAYKLNPYAFKPNEANWYRQVGESAIDDAFNTGVVRETGEEVSPRVWGEFQDQLVRMQGSGMEAALAGRRPASPFFAKGELFYPMGRKPVVSKTTGKLSKGPAAGGSADHLIETNLSNESFQPAYVKGMGLGVPEQIGQTAILKPNPTLRDIENFKFYKQDWLKGYKEVPKKEELINLYRIQEKEGKPFAQLAKEGKIPKAFNNPETIARKTAEEKHYGQWFTNDKADLDWYARDREFINPETIQLQVPKSKLSQYQNYDKTLSRAPDREFVIPQDAQKLYNQSSSSITKGPINYWEEPGFAKRNPKFNPEIYANSPVGKNYEAPYVPEELMPYMSPDYAYGGPIVDPRGQWAHPGEVTRIPGNNKNNKTNITMKDVNYPVLGIGSNGGSMMMYPEQEYEFNGSSYVDEYPMMGKGGEMIRRADGSYSKRGLWDNIRANKGSGKKPTKEMLEQERKIKAKNMENGGTNNAGFEALPEYVQAKILSQMGYGGYYNPYMAEGGEANGSMALGQIMAVSDKMNKLRQFISPEQNLDPWIASKLAVIDDSTAAISDYMMYNPEAQGEGGEEEMGEENEQEGQEEMMANGGYVVTRSNDRKGKTHKVTGPGGVVKYFGDSKLGQHPKDPERKAAFYARHKKNLAGNPFFRAFARKTWEDGGSTFSGNAWYQDGGDYDDTNTMNSSGAYGYGYEMGGYIPDYQMAYGGAPQNYYGNQAKNFTFASGGRVGQEMEVTPQEAEMLRQQGYQFQII